MSPARSRSPQDVVVLPAPRPSKAVALAAYSTIHLGVCIVHRHLLSATSSCPWQDAVVLVAPWPSKVDSGVHLGVSLHRNLLNDPLPATIPRGQKLGQRF